ncbi:MAG: hypothetical protein HY899_06405 [Deltaproteobacteria bacterium]|nr:hypothetical protein [Deltaproteobacteria bacterium]
MIRLRTGFSPGAKRLRAMSLALVLSGSVALMPANGAAAEHLSSDEPEAWAMFYFTSVTLFSGLGTPRQREPGSVEMALELGNIPHLSTEQRTVGFGGTKVEDLNNSPLLARPILTVGLPWSLALSLSYVPPVKVFGVRPNLLAMALERPLLIRGPWTAGARLHGQVGYTKGSFTCPSGVAGFPPGSDGNPYGCEATSNDKAIQNYVGLELSGSYRIDALGGLAPYLAVGANYLDTAFQVHAQTFGAPDRTKLSADTWTFSLGAGFAYPFGDNASVSLGVFYTPLWVTRPPETSQEPDSLINARTQFTYRIH